MMAHIGGQALNPVTLRSTFLAADQGHNGAIDYRELQMALSSGTWRPFNMETAKMLVDLFDRNHDGTINFDEFAELYRFVTDWSSAFRHFDKDNTGSMENSALQTALREFGYNVSDRFSDLLVRRYDKNGKIYFDEFIQICMFIKNATDAFRRYDRQKTGEVNVRFEEFVLMVMLVLV
ncbi:programmed cell death protein 6-like [Ornithodoros turicata]|uniref:programmed cell death protein 6-like n=1 Tax=Ornithodoros turicata TaxID=34597 RepID=UPI00313A2C46